MKKNMNRTKGQSWTYNIPGLEKWSDQVIDKYGKNFCAIFTRWNSY